LVQSASLEPFFKRLVRYKYIPTAYHLEYDLDFVYKVPGGTTRGHWDSRVPSWQSNPTDHPMSRLMRKEYNLPSLYQPAGLLS